MPATTASAPALSSDVDPDDWLAFARVNQTRRAVRDFAATPVADDDVRAILAEAMLAPSSGNLQPYQLHWVREPGLRARVAAACNGQRAAASAPVLLVVSAAPTAARRTLDAQLAHIDSAPGLDAGARTYYRGKLGGFRRFLALSSIALWSPIHALVALFAPTLTLLPMGPVGLRHWAARSAIYAAQTLLLAARARGLDACPMEGFSARQVARLLRLPRGHVVPIVIAVGHRRPDARIEARWRRPYADAVVEH
jgi:nitroreductase